MPEYYWIVVTSEGVPIIFKTQQEASAYAADLCKSHISCKVWSCSDFGEGRQNAFMIFDSRA